MCTITDPVDAGWGDEAAMGEDDGSRTITTTLYDLIAAIRDVVGPDDDNLVVVTTIRMLSSRSATFLQPMAASRRFVGMEFSRHACQWDTLDIT
jgi:hypothetical protein